MRFADFESVAGLNIAELRKLFAEGDSQERVWAAWALALAVGEGCLPTIREEGRAAPDPGVRRHLIVVLSGLGDVEIVRALAESDPDALVRATACQYLIQRASRGQPLEGFLQVRLRGDDAAIVRERILDTALRFSVALPSQAQLLAISDFAPEVRLAALESIAASDIESKEEVIIGAGLADESAMVRDRVLTWCVDSGHVRELLTALSEEVPDKRLAILGLLATRGVRAAWIELQPFTEDDDPAMDLQVRSLLLEPPANVAIGWYVRGVARMVRQPDDSLLATREFGYFALKQLAEHLQVYGDLWSEDCSVTDVADAIRQVDCVLHEIQREVEEAYPDEWEDSDFDPTEELERWSSVRDALVRIRR